MKIAGRKKGCSNYLVEGYIFRVYSNKGHLSFHEVITNRGAFRMQHTWLHLVQSNPHWHGIVVARNQQFQGMLKLQPNLNPTVVMSDFETALENAVSICFPRARVVSCFFHYSQAIRRRVQKLGLIDSYRDNTRITRTIKRCMALSLLPHTLIVAGLQTIREYT
uniref:MULE transposase domain-containing protein n=1 Tax=Strigamia maritima TaxID=126957 RepID=T1JLW5_STRMM